VHRAFDEARRVATGRHDGTIRVEHLLCALTRDEATARVLTGCGAIPERLRQELEKGFPSGSPEQGELSAEAEPGTELERALQHAAIHALSRGRPLIEGRDVVIGILGDESTRACSLLREEGVTLHALLATGSEGS
jgi:ATP-dependent Clp protease ATP-binding subunit ClpA